MVDQNEIYNPNREGSQSDNPGKSVMINNPIIIVIKKGSKGKKTLAILDLATPTPTNSTDPTGGVQTPIHKLSTIMIPK